MPAHAPIATFAAAVLATGASAGLAERFVVSSTLMTAPPQTAGIAGDVYGPWAADVDTATWGYVRSMMTTADFDIRMTSSMSIYNGQFVGKSDCLATYSFAAADTYKVDWNWSSLTQAGGWRVMDANGTTVAALTFSAGVFTSIGGSWSQQASGVEYLNLAAGTYTFEGFFDADQMPASSLVHFELAPIPAPGALALAGLAGFARSRRRR